MKSARKPILILLLWILGSVIAFGACQRKQRRPSRYLIPNGYVGWVRIDFKVKDAPALPIEDDHYLFIIPPSGHLETSSDLEYGSSSKDDFYYYSSDERRQLRETGWGAGGMVWSGGNGSSEDSAHNITAVYEDFFVGTEQQRNKCGSERGKNNEMQIGPLDEATLRKCMQK